MELSELPPRARRAFRAMLAAPALLAPALLAGCVSPGPTLQQFGMVGTFSEDCSKDIDQGGARAIYEARPGAYPTFTAVNRYGTFRSRIVRADRIGPNHLIMYIDDPSGAWNELDIEKEGDGFLTTRMVSHKPNQYRPVVAIGDGGIAANTEGGLFVERCRG